MTFTAPSGVNVAASSTYWVTLNEGQTQRAAFTRTTSDDQTGATSWSIADNSFYRFGSGSWINNGDSYKIEIAGTLVSGANNAPTVANAISNQTATVGTALSYVFPANTFFDADGHSLTYSATKGDGSALPSWLTFTATTRTFSGTPTAADVGTLSVKVTASDSNSGTVSGTFDITVSAPTPTITIAAGTSPVTEGTNADFTVTASPAPTNALTVDVSVAEATEGDYVAAGDEGDDTVTFTANSTTATFSVATVGDSDDEPDGSVTVTLKDGTDYTLGTTTSASVTVNDDDPTTISSIAFTNLPSIASWGIGGVIELTATFTQAVSVDTSGGTSSIPLTPAFGANSTTRNATYVSGHNSTSLVFRYTVVEGDGDGENNVAIAANSVALNGGAIRVGTTDVTVTHSAVDSGKKAYGLRAKPERAYVIPKPTLDANLDGTAETFTTATGNNKLKVWIKLANVPATRSPVVDTNGSNANVQVVVAIGSTDVTLDYSEKEGDTLAFGPHTIVASNSDTDGVTVKRDGSNNLIRLSSGATIKGANSFGANDADLTTSADMTIRVNRATATPLVHVRGPTNTVPTAADFTKSTPRNTDLTFAKSDFGFSDTNSDPMKALSVVSLPASTAGTLELDGTAIASSDLPKTVTHTELDDDELGFSPVSGFTGNATFTFKVVDSLDGESASANTATISVGATNSPASGAPTISGLAQVGLTLRSSTSGITDNDGLTTPGYTYQWIRVDGATETNISSATSSDYTLVAADSGKKVKVKVTFSDDASNAEELTSAAYPSSGNVLPAASACTTGNIWCATITVGAPNTGGGRGYCTTGGPCTSTYGALSGSTISLGGTSYTVESIRWGTKPPRAESLHLTLNQDLPDAELPNLQLKIESTAFDLSDATRGSGIGPNKDEENNYKWTSNAAIRAYAVGLKVRAELLRTNNTPTVANEIADQTATVGTAFSYTFPQNTFNDADSGDTLTYSATKSDDTALPSWLTFTPSTRNFAGTPAAADTGTLSVKVTASDSTTTVSDTFDIVVSAAPNNAPTVANTIPDQKAKVSSAFSYAFPANTFNDADGHTLTYTATLSNGNALPDWLTFTAADRSFSGTPTSIGTVSVKVTADDSNGGTVDDTFDITVGAANNAPTVGTSIPDQTATVGTAFSYTFPTNTFSDTDTSDTLTYTATKSDDSALPTWLTFTASSRNFAGTPQSANTGTLSVKVTAADGFGGSVDDTFNITVSEPNNAPTFTNQAATASVPENSANGTAVVTITATDSNTGDTVSYSLDATSDNLFAIGSTSGAITVQVESGYALNHEAYTSGVVTTVTATDNHSASTTHNVTITISDVAEPPPAPSAPSVTSASATSLSVSWTAPDVTGKPAISGYNVQYQSQADTTTWTSLTHSGTGRTATISSLTTGQAYNVQVAAINGEGTSGWSSSGSGTPTAPSNNPPTACGAEGTAGPFFGSDAVPENTWSVGRTSVTFRVSADLQNLELKFHVCDSGGTTNTTNLTFTSANPQRSITGLSAGSDYWIRMQFSNQSPTSWQHFRTTSPPNNAPTFSSQPTTADVDENSTNGTSVATVVAADTDAGATISYSLDATSDNLFAIDSDGAITVQVESGHALDYEANTSGITATVTATDNHDATATHDIAITINDVDEPPPAPGAPSVTSASATSLSVSWTAPSVTGKPAISGYNVQYQSQADTGTWTSHSHSGTSTTATITGLTAGQAYNVQVAAINAEGTGDWSSSGSGTPTAANSAPTVANAIPDQTAKVNSAFSYAFPANTFNDADGHALTYTATDSDDNTLPSWLTFTAADRSFAGTPSSTGTVSVKVTADDSNGGTVSDTFDITIGAANNAPSVANTIPDQSATVGTAFSYTFPDTTFSDADTSDSLTYTAAKSDNSALPDWLTFTASNRNFAGKPQSTDTGTLSVKVTANDGFGGSVDDTFAIEVSAANNPATGDPTISGTAQVGQTLTVSTSNIMDSDGLTNPDYTYQWIRVDGNTDSNIASTDSTQYTLVAADEGKKVKVKVTFDDDLDNSEERTSAAYPASGTIAAAPTNNAPTFTGQATTATVPENSANGTAIVTITASDGDAGSSITYSLDSTSDNLFAIDSSTGAITVQVESGYALDHEAHSSGISATVTATDNHDATATHGVTITIADVAEPPPAPSAPNVAGASTTSVSVTWSAPNVTGRPAISGYDVQYQASGATSWTSHAHTGTSTSATIGSLTQGTTYNVQIAAKNAEGTGDWSTSGTGTPSSGRPTISSVTIASTPTLANTYKAGDNIHVDVTYNQNIVVANGDSNNDGVNNRVRMRLDLGADDADTSNSRKLMTNTSVTGATLRFQYTVARPDTDTDGVWVQTTGSNNAIIILAGSATLQNSDGDNAHLTYAGLPTTGDTDHKVDAVRPSFSSATVNGTTLKVTFSETMDATGTTKPDSSIFTLSKSGSTDTIDGSSTDVTIAGAVVTATLASAVANGETVTLGYAVPSANPITDAAGNPASAFSGSSVTNNTPASTPTNNAPTFSGQATTATIAENSANGASVVTITATDGDAGSSITYSLDSTSDNLFAIDSSTGAITVQVESGSALDHEAYTSGITVTVTATDNHDATATHDVAVTISDVAEPPSAPSAPNVSSASATSLSVSWAAPDVTGKPAISGYNVQYQSQADTSNWTSHTHSGTGTSATITGLTTGQAYNVQVAATNAEGTGGWSTSGTGTPSSTNNAPVFTSQATTASVNENSANGASVVTITATDSDSGSSITYSLDATSDNLFAIGSTTGAITVQVESGYALDHEAHSSGVVATVTATDNHNATATHAVTISINDVAEPPAAPAAPSVTATSGSTTSIDVSWTAPDVTGKPAISGYDVQYQASGASDWTDHTFSGTGTTTAIASLSANTTYNVQIAATNAEGTGDWSSSGSGATGNTTPTFTSQPTTANVNENSTDTTTVLVTVVATDPDSEDSIRYSLDETSDEDFDIDSSSGEITVQSGATIDHEATPTITLTVTATDEQDATATHDVTVTINDVNEPPPAPAAPTVAGTTGQTTSIDVSWTAPDVAGKPAITDYDVQYRAEGATVWTEASHTGTGLTITVTNLSAGADYEAQVRAINDEGTGGWSDTGSGSTNNTAPVFDTPAPTTAPVPENSSGGTSVTTVSATDDDGHTLTYSLDTASDEVFNISSGGEITVQSGASLDHETTPSYTTTVTASDERAGGSVTHDITINVTDVDEPPDAPEAPTVTGTTGETTSIDVSWTAPDVAGKPAISGYDVQYKKTSDDNTSWTSHTHTGTGTSATIEDLDAGTSYDAQIIAKNDEGDSSWSATGTGSTNNTAPSFTSPPTSAVEVPENSAGGTSVVTVAATDDDGHDLTYSLDSTSDTVFNIDSNTGAITVQDGALLDHEATTNSYSTTVTVTDDRSSVDASFTINITDVDEPPGTPTGTPTVTGASTTSVTVTWTASDVSDKPPISDYDLQYRLTGTTDEWTDANIDTTSASDTITGLAAGTSYDVQVRAENDEGVSGWSATGTGSTLNTAPSFTSPPSSLSIAENSESGANVGTVAATDADGHTLTYSLDSGTDAVFDISASGVITLQSGASLNHEATSSYSATVTASDGRSDGSTDHSLTINVTDLEEPPDAPSTPTVAADSETSITVSWTAPDVTGKPPITDYDVRFYRGTSDPASETSWIEEGENGGHTHTGTDTSTTITGLFAGESYRVQVSAENDEGTSDWSASGSGTTNTATNSAPIFTNQTATASIPENSAGGTAVATVTATDGDGDELSYSLDEASDAAFDISDAGAITVQDDATLNHEATPTITITVIANDGTVNSTHDVTVTITDVNEPPNAPAAPSMDSATGISVTVTWTAPATNGQPDITDYDVRYYQGSSDPSAAADWIEPDETGGHDHTGTATTATILGLAADSSYRVQVRTHNSEGTSDWSASGNAATTELTAPSLSRVVIISTPSADQNNTYMPGDTIRARVTFSQFVDVTGAPVLTMQVGDDAQTMTLDASLTLTNTTNLDFTYEVADGDLAPMGVAFGANPLSLPANAAIRAAGSATVNAELELAEVAPDANHRVDGVPPMLVEDRPIQVSSTAGVDETYAIGDHIEFTAEFSEPVTVTGAGGQPTNGTPQIAYSNVTGPRIAFRLDDELKYAGYHRTEGNVVVFRYTIIDEDVDSSSIVIEEDALELNGGTITDTQGNTSDEMELESEPVMVSVGHAVDATPPAFVIATVKGPTLRVTFSESIDASPVVKPQSNVYTVTAVDSEGTSRTINGTNLPVRINGEVVTANLEAEVVFGETVTVSYVAQADNPLRDLPGNAAIDFTDNPVRNTTSSTGENTAPLFADPPSSLEVAENSPRGTTVGSINASDADGDTLSFALDATSDTVFDINANGVIVVQRGATLDYETTASYDATVTVDDGTDSNTHSLTILVINEDEPPISPSAPSVKSASATSLNVSWTAPDSTGKTALSDYDIRYQASGADEWTDAEFEGAETNTILEDLIEGTTYAVQIRATNAEGTSNWSASGHGTPIDPAKNAAPTFIEPSEALSIAENSVGGARVGIVEAIDPEGGALIFSLDETSNDLFVIDNSGVISVRDGVLLDHESMPSVEVTVTVSDEIAEASLTLTILITNVVEPLGAPTALTVTAASDTELLVNWELPDLSGLPPISEYVVRYRATGSSEWAEQTFDGSTPSVTLIGLIPVTSYEVQVRAINAEATGEWSSSGNGTTQETPINTAPTFMEPPSTLEVAENSDVGTEVGMVSATDAEDDELMYSLDVESDEVFDIDATGTIAVGEGSVLDYETKSRFDTIVTVSDGEEIVTHSLVIYVNDIREAPGIPAAPMLSTPSSNPRSSIAVSWEAPVNTGPAINDYDVTYRVSSTSNWMDANVHGTSTSTTLNGLMSGTIYDVRVRASNVEGVGDWSDTASHAVEGLSAMDTSPITQAWLARFGRTVTDEVNEAVAARRLAPRESQTNVALAGQALSSWMADGISGEDGRDVATGSNVANWVEHDDPFNNQYEGWREPGPGLRELTQNMLSNSSFALSSNANGDGRGSTTLWGRGSIAGFSGSDGDLDLDGTVKTGFLAVDYTAAAKQGHWMLGLALGHAQGMGDYENPVSRGQLDTRVTGFFPYGVLQISDRFSVWSTAGYGSGKLTFAPDDLAPLDTDVTLTMGSIGLRNEMLNPGASTGFTLALKGDARFTQTSADAASNGGITLAPVDASTWLTRFGVEGSRSVTFPDGSTASPLIEIALRLDGGDAETGYGVDIGGGFSFAVPNNIARVDIRGRGLLTHQVEDFQEWGASASFVFDPQPSSASGLSLSLTQSLGVSPMGGMETLFAQETLDSFGINNRHTAGQGFEAARQLECEIGYGLPTSSWGTTSTPYVGVSVSDYSRDYRFGWRLTAVGTGIGSVDVNLDAVHRDAEGFDTPSDQGVLLSGSLSW